MVNLVNFGLWFWNFCEILRLERPCWQVSSVKPISIFCEILHFFQIFEKYFKKSHFYTVLLSTLKKRPVDFKWFSQWSKKQFFSWKLFDQKWAVLKMEHIFILAKGFIYQCFAQKIQNFKSPNFLTSREKKFKKVQNSFVTRFRELGP